MGAGLTVNPEALSLDQLRAKAWEAVEPSYQQRLAGLVENYRLAASRQLGSDDLTEVARAATAGRVATLLVESERVIPGRLDPATGRIESGELADPGVDDVIDDLAELVLRMKGNVVVVPGERMPSTTGAAATYRY